MFPCVGDECPKTLPTSSLYLQVKKTEAQKEGISRGEPQAPPPLGAWRPPLDPTLCPLTVTPFGPVIPWGPRTPWLPCKVDRELTTFSRLNPGLAIQRTAENSDLRVPGSPWHRPCWAGAGGEGSSCVTLPWTLREGVELGTKQDGREQRQDRGGASVTHQGPEQH